MTTLLTAQVGVYRLASRLLASEIDAALLARLHEAGLLDEELVALPKREALDTLATEFCRLVIGPDPVCLPYASVQRGETLLGSRAEQEVTAFVRRHGLDITLAPDVAVLTHDHLSVQLALLAHLHSAATRCEDVPRAAITVPPGSNHAPAAAAELVERHLAPWAVTTADVIADAATWEPYRSVLRTTAELLRDELERVGG